MTLNHDIPDKDLVNKATFGNWCYYKENRLLLGLCKLAMKIILVKSGQILEGVGREKNVNVSILLMRV